MGQQSGKVTSGFENKLLNNIKVDFKFDFMVFASYVQ